jgi:hypothetical protein
MQRMLMVETLKDLQMANQDASWTSSAQLLGGSATWSNSKYCGITGSGSHRPERSTGFHLVNLGYDLMMNLVYLRLVH